MSQLALTRLRGFGHSFAAFFLAPPTTRFMDEAQTIQLKRVRALRPRNVQQLAYVILRLTQLDRLWVSAHGELKTTLIAYFGYGVEALIAPTLRFMIARRILKLNYWNDGVSVNSHERPEFFLNRRDPELVRLANLSHLEPGIEAKPVGAIPGIVTLALIWIGVTLYGVILLYVLIALMAGMMMVLLLSAAFNSHARKLLTLSILTGFDRARALLLAVPLSLVIYPFRWIYYRENVPFFLLDEEEELLD